MAIWGNFQRILPYIFPQVRLGVQQAMNALGIRFIYEVMVKNRVGVYKETVLNQFLKVLHRLVEKIPLNSDNKPRGRYG